MNKYQVRASEEKAVKSSRKAIKSADKHYEYDEYFGNIYDLDETNKDYWSREEYNEMVETTRDIFYPAVQKAANACHFTVSDNEAEYVAEKCVRCFFDNTSWEEAVNRPEEYYVKSSRKAIKSGYYDDPVNHPEGGGTCDYCGAEIAPGDGYESDFASSQDTAARYLFLALGGDEKYAYTVVENWHNFVQWLQGADEDIDEDWLQDAVNDICRMAFGNSDGYMCSTCLDKTIKEAAEKWVEENW